MIAVVTGSNKGKTFGGFGRFMDTITPRNRRHPSARSAGSAEALIIERPFDYEQAPRARG